MNIRKVNRVLKLKPINVYIGGKLVEARLNKNMTQVRLAKLMGMSRVSCVNMEKGKQAMSVERILQACIILRKEFTDFIPSRDWYAENRNKTVTVKITYEIN